ncbi:hypothetical protein TREMEDRAFT_57345 [Tremella mesenterica DSM 1558]|nr:uncharacterized protein TREMEDRAFT_57345 [Tremella mesenterica DSM 1558]EIW67801.1 hypothetical protein TREMEDRAFT_57345 [Tremella mesenterica DSM 1558]
MTGPVGIQSRPGRNMPSQALPIVVENSSLGMSTLDTNSTLIQSTITSGDSRQTLSSMDSASTVLSLESPHKPKLKGQIQSLAKMLSGLKTKGKD